MPYSPKKKKFCFTPAMKLRARSRGRQATLQNQKSDLLSYALGKFAAQTFLIDFGYLFQRRNSSKRSLGVYTGRHTSEVALGYA